MRKLSKRISAVLGAAFLAAAGGAAVGIAGTGADAAVTQAKFHMVRSSAAVGANCLKGADAKVTIQSQGPVEVMRVSANHLPRNTDFDLFVIQVPNAPFGISWYQGDLESDSAGHAHGTFIGRFSVETFAVAPMWRRLPRYSSPPFPDARTRRSIPCRCTTWACGSTRRRNQPQPAVRPRSRRSTVSTTPACRR